MSITIKQYYCPLCGNEEKHSTNHYGTIYCACKNCGSTCLYCKDFLEGVTKISKKIVNVRLKTYCYNISIPEERLEYKHFLENMKENYPFKCLKSFSSHKRMELIKKHQGEEIDIYIDSMFSNRAYTNIGHLFYWYEEVYPNKNIKSGYYLIDIDELIKTLKNTWICEYCGSRYFSNIKCTRMEKCSEYNTKNLMEETKCQI